MTTTTVHYGVIYDIPYRIGVLARIMGYKDRRTCRKQLMDWGVPIVRARGNQEWVSGRLVRLAIERQSDEIEEHDDAQTPE